MIDPGTFVDADGRPAVRFQRTIPHSQQRLWRAITDPDELAHWFPSRVELEPRAGGRVAFTGDPNLPPSSGTVLVYDPPRQLAYTWGNDELHFELEAVSDEACRLTLTNVLEARQAAARNAAGWELCLAELATHLSGGDGAGPHATDMAVWWRMYDAYVAAGLPSGAHVPAQRPGASA
jgi:uncharacterized protein YndB with AHSA1/START domain